MFKEDVIILGTLVNSPKLFEAVAVAKLDDQIAELIVDELKHLARLLFKVPEILGHYSGIDAIFADDRFKDLRRLTSVTDLKIAEVEAETKEIEEYGRITNGRAKVHAWLKDRQSMALIAVNLEISAKMAEADDADLTTLIEKRKSITSKVNQSLWKNWGESYSSMPDDLDCRHFQLGIPSIDEQLSNGEGFKSGNILVIAAMPACGKSTLLNQFIIENSNTTQTLYISLENSYSELKAMFNDYYVGKGLDPSGQANLKLSYVDDKSDLNDIIRIIREHKEREPNLGIVAIDYAQLLQNREIKGATLYSRLESTSNALTELKKLGILIVLLSQIDKESLKPNARGEVKKLSHNNLKGGTIGESASYCLILQRVSESTEQKAMVPINLYLSKNRHGSPVEQCVSFFGAKRQFKEMA